MTSSDIRRLVRKTIAPEANHLLTERPNRPEHPGDFGWFCREHCIVTHAVFKALGHPLDIVGGHISAFYPGRLALTTTRTPGDEHWWCSSVTFPVIDLSMTLKHFPNAPFTIGPILGDGPNGEFTIIITPDKRLHRPDCASPTIIYTPFEARANLSIEPAAGFIAAAIAIHILDVIRGAAESYQSTPQEDALNELADKYPNAMNDVSRIARSA